MPPAAPRIYLASKSPRRRDLLRQIGVSFDVIAFRSGGARGEDADVDETPLADEPVERYVERLAHAKAEAGVRRIQWRRLAQRLVLAADTTLELDGEIIGKPVDTADARRILAQLSGRSHRVLTAIAVADGERVRSALSVSEVRFRTLTEDEIRRYIATGEPMDKAGAYGIQGRAAMFIEDIRGSYTGIMGLPLYETSELLAAFGYPLWSQSAAP